MTNSQELKNKLGQTTEQLENKLKELTPFYTNLEPWQRGTLILALLLLLLLTIYYLTRPTPVVNSKLLAKKEKEVEERILRQMAYFKKLKE